MNDKLFKAILSMDSYNRGYGAGIQFVALGEDSIDEQLGSAIIIRESDIDAGSDGVNASFYATAYEYNGGTTISYRGTDNFAADFLNGFGLGLGLSQDTQTIMAVNFYKEVAKQIGGPTVDYMDTELNISTTGHSLGGGHAGLVARIYSRSAEVSSL